jgi:hypothetical protein
VLKRKDTDVPRSSTPSDGWIKKLIDDSISQGEKQSTQPRIETIPMADPIQEVPPIQEQELSFRSPEKKRVSFKSTPDTKFIPGRSTEELRRSSRSNKGVNDSLHSIDKVVDIPNRRKLHSARMNLWCIAAYLRDRTQAHKPMNMVYSAGQVQIQEALRSEYAKEAEEAALAELAQLIKIKAWKYIKNLSEATPSVHKNITPCSMFLKPKHDTTGAFLLWKARLVAGGHRTDPSAYDPVEKHSPTIPIEVAMLQLGIASYEKANVEVFDIPCAYLNAHLAPEKRQLMRFSKSISRLILKELTSVVVVVGGGGGS